MLAWPGSEREASDNFFFSDHKINYISDYNDFNLSQNPHFATDLREN